MKSKIMLLILILFSCFSFVFASSTVSIHSSTAVAMDADSSVILYNKSMNEKIYPASTTKILTAILAIENLDMNKAVVVSKKAVSIPWDSSAIYLKEGEVITVEELLYGLLLNSGNDAANVLAEAVSGNIQSFVELMNKKAAELGCTNTHFNNAHGYSDDKHYTTALDMAKIFNYCIQNETFVKIISTKSYIINETNKTNEKRYLNNTNRLILKKEDSIHARYYEYCIGGKTGYTDEAGRTLITFAKKDNKTVIVAVFGASSGGKEDVRYTDAINLFEYSFNNYAKQIIANASDYTFNYINTNNRLNYQVGLKENVQVMLKQNTNPHITYTLNIDESNLKNIAEGEDKYDNIALGTITFNMLNTAEEQCTVTKKLYLKNIQSYTNTSNVFIYIIIAFLALVILITLVLLVRIFKHSKTSSINKSRKSRRKI